MTGPCVIEQGLIKENVHGDIKSFPFWNNGINNQFER